MQHKMEILSHMPDPMMTRNGNWISHDNHILNHHHHYSLPLALPTWKLDGLTKYNLQYKYTLQ